jgi:hypothetical protein
MDQMKQKRRPETQYNSTEADEIFEKYPVAGLPLKIPYFKYRIDCSY